MSSSSSSPKKEILPFLNKKYEVRKGDSADIDSIPDDISGESTLKNISIHTAHIIGDRVQQEDADTHFECEYFKAFSSVERKKIMRLACKRIHEGCAEFGKKDGACANFTIAWRENNKLIIYTANSGDVASFYGIEKKEHITGVNRINPSLHLASDVKGVPGYSTYIDRDGTCRLNGRGLMMYRCFGNHGVGSGHSGEVDVTKKIVTLASDEKPYVLVGCDGLTDIVNLLTSPVYLGSILKLSKFNELMMCYEDQLLSVRSILAPWIVYSKTEESVLKKQSMEGFIKEALQCALTMTKKTSEKNIAWHLANIGYCGSTDNISVKVMVPTDIPVCMGILDGHSGRLSADFASEHFKEFLLDEAYQLMLTKVKSSSVYESELSSSLFLVNQLLAIKNKSLFHFQQSLKKMFVMSLADIVNEPCEENMTVLQSMKITAKILKFKESISFFLMVQLERLDKASEKIIQQVLSNVLVDEEVKEEKKPLLKK